MTKSMSVVFRLILVRHGETLANREMRIQGHSDVPLSETGKSQATLTGQALHHVHFSRAITSDLSRAFATCTMILNRNKYHIPDIVTDLNLRERHFGSIEMMKFDEVKAAAEAAGTVWPNFHPDGAETITDVQVRMVSFFKQLCQSVYDKYKAHDTREGTENGSSGNLKEADTAENILVVSHGAALKQLFVYFHKVLQCHLDADIGDLGRISPNAGISEYLIRYSTRTYELECLRFHDTSHLQNLEVTGE